MMRGQQNVLVLAMVGCVFIASVSLRAQGLQPVMSKDGKSATFAVAADKVFVAAVRAAASKWSVTFSDKDSGTVAFLTGTSAFKNRALQVSVSVIRLSESETKVEIATQKKSAGQAWFGMSMKADGGLIKDYFVALTAQLTK